MPKGRRRSSKGRWRGIERRREFFLSESERIDCTHVEDTYTQHENYSTEDVDADAAAATTTSYVQNVKAADGATRSAFGQHPLKKPLKPSIR